MIMVAGDLPGLSFPDFAFRITKPIPDGKTPTVLLVRTLDLICRGGCTPQKVVRKTCHPLGLIVRLGKGKQKKVEITKFGGYPRLGEQQDLASWSFEAQVEAPPG